MTQPSAGDRRIRARFLGDTSHSVKRDAEYLASFDWAPVDYQGGVFVDSFSQWQESVREIGKNVDFLLVGGYRKLHKDGEKGFVPPKQVMSWTEANSPVPVIGMNVFNTTDGAMLSVGVSPYEQGEAAAEIAFHLLHDGWPISQLPIRTSQQYVISIRKNALDQRGLKLPKIFEAFSRATNNYYD